MSTTLMVQKRGQEKRKLPDGWRWVRLGSVIQTAQAGFACGERDPEGIVQLRMNNLDTHGNFVWKDVLRIPKESKNIDLFLLMPGDVLFNNTNSTELVGKSALFEGYAEPIVYSNHFTRLRTLGDILLPEILASWLNQQWQEGVFAAICNRWIGQSAVKADKLLNLEIPIPPVSVQKRIAELLKKQMAAVEKARAAAQARLEAAKALPAAFLREVFPQSGQLLPNKWRWVKLGEICEFEYGSSLIEAARKDGAVPVYGSNGIVGYHNIPLTSGPSIVIGRKGSVGQVHYSPDPCFPIDTTYYIEKTRLPVDLRWFAYILSVLGLPNLNKASGVPGLNRNDVYKLVIPFPSISEQKRIAHILKRQMTAVEKTCKATEEELNAINALPAVLLRRAFNGEL